VALPDLLERPIAERFNHLLHVLRSKRFLSMEGLGNEVPFFICPFHPQEAVEWEKIVLQLKNQLEISGIHVLVVNLYDLCLDMIRREGNWDMVIEFEKENSKAELLDLLQGMLDPQDFIIPAIAEKFQNQACQVLLITGVGEVYPYLRSHSLLNNLQSTVKSHPMVMFYPGKYVEVGEGSTSLVLFDRLRGNQYYRAFNILNYQI